MFFFSYSTTVILMTQNSFSSCSDTDAVDLANVRRHLSMDDSSSAETKSLSMIAPSVDAQKPGCNFGQPAIIPCLCCKLVTITEGFFPLNEDDPGFSRPSKDWITTCPWHFFLCVPLDYLFDFSTLSHCCIPVISSLQLTAPDLKHRLLTKSLSRLLLQDSSAFRNWTMNQ